MSRPTAILVAMAVLAADPGAHAAAGP
ncbi:MAG: hypothetical protein H6Q09_1447, partial [Acidobacteria bacterium]|nr:hypothetical protein [Acidobacteriota bacterium]